MAHDRYSPKNTNIIFSDVLIITDLNILIIMNDSFMKQILMKLIFDYNIYILQKYTVHIL